MEDITIRKVTPEDTYALQEIGRTTFTETFAGSNTVENMNKYLKESFSEQKIIKEINDPHTRIYFAELNEAVVGYLKVNIGQSQTEIQYEKAIEIERIYVLKDLHGKKVGQLLYEKAMDIANETGAEYTWLGVWEKNARAISFYKKNGFIEFDQHVFTLGSDIQTDIMMKKILVQD